MATIDFSQIRSTPKSKNDSFESLAILLFKAHCEPSQDSSFFSLRGDGGDGGVEAYFKSPTGNILGVQAKYFFQLGSSEFGQIKQSLTTALKNHPTLSEYWIYIPFDLTGRVAEGKRGKSEVEKFEEWCNEVATQQPNLKIKLVTAEIIRQQILSIDRSGGFVIYWFNENILTNQKIQSCIDSATAFAGPRYCNDLDIITEAHDALDAFGEVYDFKQWVIDTWKPLKNDLRTNARYLKDAFSQASASEKVKAMQLFEALLDKVSSKHNILEKTILCSILDIIKSLKPYCENAITLQEEHFFTKHGAENDTPSFRQFQAEYMCAFPAGDLDASRDLLALILNIEKMLYSPLIQSYHAHSLLLTGPAGAGKTHSIVSFAKRRLEKGAYTLVLFGEDLDNAEPWDVVRNKLGFGSDIGRDKLLSCLQASAQANEHSFIIAIDALNEGTNARKWKNKLPEIIQQLKEYHYIKIVVSARDTYTNLVVDERFPGYAYNHIGFTRSFHEVLLSFSQHYNIESEITPIFSDELRNPLLLHLFFKTYKSEGSAFLDISTNGFSDIFSKYLQQVDNSLRERLGYVNPKNIVRGAMLKLSDALAHSSAQTISYEVAIDTIKPNLGSELSPEKFIDELVKEQLLILSIADDEDILIKLGYQRFGDMLQAYSIIQSYQDIKSKDISAIAEKLALLTDEESGVLEALASILPEQVEVEITDENLGLDRNLAYKCFVKSLTWRSKQSITPDIEEYMYGALYTGGLWQNVYESLFQLSVVPDHYLNIDGWFRTVLRRQAPPSRDAYLSVALSESYDKKGAIWFLIEALEQIDATRWPEESYKLASSILLWCCSATDRRVRDRATRCLVLLFKKYPTICAYAVQKFALSNDEYILESLILAMYTACLLLPESAEEFVQPLNKFIDDCNGSINILIREHSQLLKQELVSRGIEEDRILDQFESHPSLPSTWPVLSDVQALLSLENLPSNMCLWGDKLLPDFWRYQVESKLRVFDLESKGITHENIACWIMKEAESIGYPGYANTALKHDLVTLSIHGRGRAKPAYVETIGKKCYWIALHRLIGLLAKNIPVTQHRWEPQLSSDTLWSLALRKVDVSDIRNLLPLPKYPFNDLIKKDIEIPKSGIDNWLQTDDYFLADNVVILKDENEVMWINLNFHSEIFLSQDEDEASYDTERFLCISSYDGYFIDTDNTNTFELYNNSNHCYRVYLAEYPRSPAFKQCIDEQDTSISDDQRIFSNVRLLRGGEWEYDYSSSIEQSGINMPCPDLVEQMNLCWDQSSGWIDENGNLAVFSYTMDRNSYLYIRKNVLDEYLSKSGKSLVFSRFGRKQLSKGVGDNFKLMEVAERYLYKPCNSSAELISTDTELIGLDRLHYTN